MHFFRAAGARPLFLALNLASFILMAGPSHAEGPTARYASGKTRPDVSRAATNGSVAQVDAADEDDALLALMISMVSLHDVAVVAGVLPFPAISYTAEVTEFGVNLGLKALPPRLIPPDDRSVDPNGPAGPGYTADGCGIEFKLLSAQAGYANMFGIANIRDPYTQLSPFKIYLWKNIRDPADVNAETRWGFLRAPSVYHANTDVKLEIMTPGKVRTYDQATGGFQRSLLADRHVRRESRSRSICRSAGMGSSGDATTQINTLGDIAVPAVMLIFNVLSELKNIYGGAKAAKLAKNSGIGEGRRGGSARSRGGQAAQRWRPEVQRRLEEGLRGPAGQKSGDRCREGHPGASSQVAPRGRQNRRHGAEGCFRQSRQDGIRLHRRQHARPDQIHRRTRDCRRRGSRLVRVQRALPDRRPGYPDPVRDRQARRQRHHIIRRILQDYGTGLVLKLLTIDTAVTERAQRVTVWDSRPPTINLDPAPLVIEATDFGGTRLSRVRAQLTALAQAATSDNCGRKPDVTIDGPELLLLGPQQVTVTARDLGPNPPGDGQDYAPTAVQNIIVRDTQPPLLLAPPSKVILDTAPVALAQAQIGDAARHRPRRRAAEDRQRRARESSRSTRARP